MKITQTIAIASAILLATGCAHEEHHAQYDESISPYASDGTPRYNAVGGSYSPGGVSEGATSGRSENTMGGPSSASQSDNTIVTQVRQSLQSDPEIAPIVPNIQISANNGTVVLSGSVRSDEQKRQIESIVHNAGGVVTVKNQLQVSSGEQGRTGQGSENANQGSESQGSMGQTSRPGEQKSMYSGDTNNIQQSPSSNPALNPNSAPSGQSGEGGTLNPTSTSNNSPTDIYQNSSNSVNNAGNGTLNPTSRSSNSPPSEYQERGTGNSSSNALNPTSRTNSGSQIYQEDNQGQNTQQQNTNSNNQTP